MLLSRIIIFIGFILIIIFPTVNGFFGITQNKNTEKAAEMDIPEFDIQQIAAWIPEYDTYYKKNFPGRSVYFKLIADLKYKTLGTSVLPDKVIAGKNGFLFLGNHHDRIIDKLLGIHVFSKAELQQLRNRINAVNNWMTKQGIAFYIAIAPNKTSFYPENLPFEVLPQITQLDQLLAMNQINAPICYLNPLPPEHLEDDTRLFIPKNSHWNQVGAFHAFNSLMEIIQGDFPAIQPLDWQDYKIKEVISRKEDIALMLDMKTEEVKYFMKRIHHKAENHQLPKRLGKKGNYEIRYQNDVQGNRLKVLVIRDSFGTFLVDYFNQVFYETLFIKSPIINTKLIQKEKPDIVIFEIVERNISKIIEK